MFSMTHFCLQINISNLECNGKIIKWLLVDLKGRDRVNPVLSSLLALLASHQMWLIDFGMQCIYHVLPKQLWRKHCQPLIWTALIFLDIWNSSVKKRKTQPSWTCPTVTCEIVFPNLLFFSIMPCYFAINCAKSTLGQVRNPVGIKERLQGANGRWEWP